MSAQVDQSTDLPAVLRDPRCITNLSLASLEALGTELEQKILLGTAELRVWGTLARIHSEIAKRKRTAQ